LAVYFDLGILAGGPDGIVPQGGFVSAAPGREDADGLPLEIWQNQRG
jgi:hypothetical protein